MKHYCYSNHQHHSFQTSICCWILLLLQFLYKITILKSVFQNTFNNIRIFTKNTAPTVVGYFNQNDFFLKLIINPYIEYNLIAKWNSLKQTYVWDVFNKKYLFIVIKWLYSIVNISRKISNYSNFYNPRIFIKNTTSTVDR